MKDNFISNTLNMVKYNLHTALYFELVFKLLLGVIFMPMAFSMFNLAMKLTGYSYLTLENIIQFLINPITFCLLVIIIIFLTFITVFDISTLIIIFDESYHHKKIGLLDAIGLSLSKCKKHFNFKNIGVPFLVLFLIPFLNIGIGSNVIVSIKIPEFIMDYINSNGTLLLIYVGIYIFLLSLLSKWIFSLHYMVIEDKDFNEAKKLSKELIKGERLASKLKILLVQVLFSVFFIAFLLIGIMVIVFIDKLLNKFSWMDSVIITIVWLFIAISFIGFALISNAVSYALISSLFYKQKLVKKEKIIPIKYTEKEISKKKRIAIKIMGGILVAFAIISGTSFTHQVLTGETNLNIEYVRTMEITAHRGASVEYPENTMAAFKGAKELGADWIELDVQQTKDKKIVVAHDSSLSRVGGINKNINDLTYDEIKNIDVGSFFSTDFKDERIPLLSDVLEFAKENNIRLNIELKPAGKEENFEKDVVDLIKYYNMEDRCVVTSQIYKVLENVKKVDSDIKTVYVMSIAIGNITDAEYADAFSVEATNVTTGLVERVHNSGKLLYAWTVNTSENITKMIDLGVDNIITDNITLAKELVVDSKNSNLIIEFFKAILE